MAQEVTVKTIFQFQNLKIFIFLFFVIVGLATPGLTQDSDTAPDQENNQDKQELESTGEPQIKETPKEKPKLPQNPSALNPETLRMLEMIAKKNEDLKRREEELQLRESNLKILEEKVLADLKKIEEVLARSEEQVGIKRDLIEKNVKSLVKVYSAMKPNEAATLLEAMDQGVAIQIISKMKSKIAGKVLAKMKTRSAKNISEKIAGKRDRRKVRQ